MKAWRDSGGPQSPAPDMGIWGHRSLQQDEERLRRIRIPPVQDALEGARCFLASKEGFKWR